MGSYSVTCHPAVVESRVYPKSKQVLDLATPEGCKAELTCYVKTDRLGIEPATCQSQVQRPTAEPPRNTYVLVKSMKLLYIRPGHYRQRSPFAEMPSWHSTSQLGQLSLLPSVGREMSSRRGRSSACDWEGAVMLCGWVGNRRPGGK